jgi:mono/diheme cytochrome c family protein
MHLKYRLSLIAFSGIVVACTASPTVEAPVALETNPVIPTAKAAISGMVLDQDGQPVPHAVVRVQASATTTNTDTQGRFRLADVTTNRPLTLTAFAHGYYIREAKVETGQSNLVFNLQAHPSEDNPDYEWLSSEKCAECHAAKTDALTGSKVLPYDEWRQDSHSQAALNERFLTMYNGTDVYGRRSPLTNYIIQRDYGRFPLRPNLKEPYYGPGYKLDFPESAGNCAACHLPAAAVNDPYDMNPNAVTDVGSEGITCDFCHKIWGAKLDPSTGLPYANMPGVLSFEFRRPSGDHQLFIGPFDDVAPGEDTFSPLQNQSQFCAACHFGRFWDTVIYNSFGEWLASPYANPASGLYQTCQDCHMPRLGTDHFAQFEVGGSKRSPETISSHRMPGASDPALLRNSVELRVTVERSGQLIETKVEVTNSRVGHHLPTDSPLRQVFLVVKATNEQGWSLPLQEGSILPNWAGDLAGQPGIYFAKILEDRWTRITPTGTYWRPTRLVEDTRLPALATATSFYTFTALDQGKITIEATLIFRRAYYELMQQKGWNTPDIVMKQVITSAF